MASTSLENCDEHTSLKNELIFLSKLLHQHKQKAKTTHVKHEQKLGQSNHKKLSNHHPPCKKHMVWRRAGSNSTTTQDVKGHQTVVDETKALPVGKKHSEKCAKVNSHTQKSTASSSFNQSIHVNTNNSGKYTKLNSVTQNSTAPFSFNQSLSAKAKNSGKYAQFNTITQKSTSSSSSNQSQSGLKNEKIPPQKVNKLIKPSIHTLVNAEHNLIKKSISVLKQCSSLENKSRIVNRPEVNNHKDKFTNHNKKLLYSPTNILKGTKKEVVSEGNVSVSTANTKDKFSSPKKSPNSKYVWEKKENSLMKASGSGLSQVITATKRLNANQIISVSAKSKNAELKAEVQELLSKSPTKYLSGPQNRKMTIKTKYKLHRNSQTPNKTKNRKTVYSSTKVYSSPNVKKIKTHTSIKKTPKPSGSSRHRWVCEAKKDRPHDVGKHSPNDRSQAVGYSKSKFTWRKEQPKTKQVSVCGYKLINVGKTPHRNQTPFMERRKKYVNSHTPVLPRSRFKLRKKQLSTISPGVKIRENTRTPLGRTVNNSSSALFTIKKTRRKIVRKQMSPTSVTSYLVSGKECKVTPLSTKNHEFKVHSSGKKLKRLRKPVTSISSIDNNTTRISILMTRQFISSRKLVAQQVLHRSIVTSNQAKYKTQNKASSTKQRYCTYYNRFGKCTRGDKCQYIHDSDKVAVCTRFLRGKCKQTDGTCPFSHKISKDKMPVCSYFLRGICNRDNCPYLHVNVSRNAAVCPDFLRGYCPAGDKCKKKHSLECPNYQRDGNCPRGRQCRLRHRQLKVTKRKTPITEEKSVKKKKREAIEKDDCSSELPSFISLKDEDSDWINTPNTSILGEQSSATPELLIRPKFTSQ